MLNSPIEEIKSKLDIVDVVSNYVRLQKTGANYRALCPFHSEKNPSFFVSPARQIWHCFSCGKGGDIFGFIKEIENVEFGDALKILAQRAGVELKSQDPGYARWRTERQKLLEICELSARFFEKQLQSSQKGQEAKEYLLSRKISEDSIENWRLGYAPNTWNGLTDFLGERGYRNEEIVKAGLAVQKEISNTQHPPSNIQIYDRFRGRIMFPVFDLNSQVIGFGGRIFEQTPEEIAKYINTPATLIYNKSQILYGLNEAKMEIRKENKCVLVEGYTDVIMSHQVGVKFVVATSGTALTQEQLKILKRYSDELFTCFDMDIAGDSATKRGVNLAQAEGFNIKVVTLSQKSDPADFISSQGGDDWVKAIEGAKSFLDFCFESAFSKFDKESSEGKREISKILLPVIKRIPSNIEQSHWVSQLSYKLKVPEDKIWEDLAKTSPELNRESLESGKSENFNLPRKTRREILEERILRLLFGKPQNIELIKESPFRTTLVSQVFEGVKSEGLNFKLDDFQKKISPETSQFIDSLLLRNDCEKKFEELDHSLELKLCLKEIKKIDLREKLIDLGLDIQIQEKEEKDINPLMEEFGKLTSELADLEKT
ncbi:MAG: DNA primase [Parcubacteria group bacterium CG11_big_fil_rev_8_21_14_0_20_39_14]|nr:MAG: DNA primase [Parcubacteria group bacterium CG11_big_fil_rev_8_21_14_0_20_39_14]PIS35189.1 MAG: DNA primase [Parcubacteria group bacterium CG08_land_8_20_14_0_20_38_56]